MKSRSLIPFVTIVFAALSVLMVACSDSADHNHSLAEAVAEGSTVTEYTCSMHPEVRSTDPDEPCPICGMDLIPVSRDDANADTAELSISFSPRALAQMQVQVSPVLQSDAVEQIELQGTVNWDTRHLKALTAWSSGRIERLYVDEVGETVQRGEVIAELYSPELLSAQQEYLDAVRLIQSERMSPGLRNAAQETLRAAEQRLALLGIPEADIERLRSGQHQANTVPIYAPVAGVVLESMVTLGQYVERGQMLAQIADPNKVWVELDVFPAQQSVVEVGQTVEIKLGDSNTTHRGEIVLLSPSISADRRTLTARVELLEATDELQVGAFVIGYLRHTHSNQLLVPKSAVLYTGQRSWIYVQTSTAERSFEGKEITLGKELGDFYEVRAGLQAGELVVTRGAFKIDSEMQLRGKTSMMNRMDMQLPVHEHDAHTNADRPVTAEETQPRWSPNLDLNSVVEQYFAMWNALHTDNLSAWQTAAQDYYREVDTITWPETLRPQQQNLAKGAGHAHHVGSLDIARDHFFYQSLALIQLLKTHGVSVEAHIAYCPMARNGAGAEWVQPNRELRNPYFGSMMLRCGEMRAQVGGEGVTL